MKMFLQKVLVLTSLLVTSHPAVRAEEFKGKVISVQDGDSLTVLNGKKPVKTILYGIDCPELKQSYGSQAREFTNASCYGKIVSIEDLGRDKNGRTIARVFLPDGSSLNEKLVGNGLAWWSDKYAPKDKVLKELQLAAQSARNGLWSENKPVPPWIFRNGEKSVQAVIKPQE